MIILGKECITCPEIYANDVENRELCDLYEDLEILSFGSSETTTTIPQVPLHNVSCKYSDNPTSAVPLCDLWCDIQQFNSAQCIECPTEYTNNIQQDLLCDLHEELVLFKENATTPAFVDFVPVKCKYEDDATSSSELCSLWCAIQEFDGYQCIQCPDKYKDDPERKQLCDLYDELQINQYNTTKNTTDATVLAPVVCVYEDNPTSAEGLCELWCAIQELDGFRCIMCPEAYLKDPEVDTLCDLNEQLQILKYNNSLTDSMAFEMEPVVCAFEDNPTSSVDLCDLWCQIQV